MPLWAGLRDSHKIAGVLALAVATFSGIGVHALLEKIGRSWAAFPHVAAPTLFLLPVIFGLYEWGGFQKQLQPVWYPDAWHEAKAVLDTEQEIDARILVLPWHGYLSLDFANQLVVANPAPAFFGRERVVSSKNAEIDSVYDQERAADYRDIDTFLRAYIRDGALDPNAMLARHRVRYIFMIMNKAGDARNALSGSLAEFGDTQSSPEEDGRLASHTIFNAASGRIILDKTEAQMKRIEF